jgi:hypothetical protein
LKGAAPLADQRVNVRLEHREVAAVEFLNRRDDRSVGGRLERTRAGPASPYAAMFDKFHVLGGTPFLITRTGTEISLASARLGGGG